MGAPLSATITLGVWLVFVFLPIALASFCWKLAQRRSGWILHVSLAPVLIATEWVMIQLLFYASGDDGDGPPGLGLAIIPGLLTFIGSLLGYYGRLAFSRRKSPAG